MSICSWNSTQALLNQKPFNTWKEAVPIDCSSYILNWKNAIGAEACGQVANSFDLSEMWLPTQLRTILRNLKINRKQSFNSANQGDLSNEDSMISEFRKTGRAARSIPRPLGRGDRAQFDFNNMCSKIFVRNRAIKFMPLNFRRIMFTCSWNFTQASLCQKSFNTWKEAVLIGCSSFILNWRNAIGAETSGPAANSFDLSEM